MVWYIYIVQCVDSALYTGITSNIDRRIKEHNANDKLGSRFVRVRRPVKLIYSEIKQSRSEALKRESEIKGWSRKKKFILILGQAKTE